MNKPELVVMCGLSGSGKSTIAAKLADKKNAIIVSTDAIREELTGKVEDQSANEQVFKLFHERIRKNLDNKYSVIADATNISMKSRRAILEKVNGLNIIKTCYIVAKPFDICKADNPNREHPVPDLVLDKQIRSFQVPFYQEGWDDIIVKRFVDSPKYSNYKHSISEFFYDMADFDQENPHHTLTLDKHCEAAYKSFVELRCPHSSFYDMTQLDGYMAGAKLHDIGKKYCKTYGENGIAHFFQHHCIGGYKILSQLACPKTWKNPEIELLDCCFLINYHMLPFDWEKNKTQDKWKKRFGDYKYRLLMDFHECDITAR